MRPTDTRDDRAEPALRVLKRLTAALQTCRLYGARHPRTEHAVAGVAALAARGMRSDGDLIVEVTRGAWRLPADETERVTDQITPLLQALAGHGVRAVAFEPGTTDAELRELLAVLVLPIEKVRAEGGPAEALRSRDVRHVTIRETGAVAGADSPPGPARPDGGGSQAQTILKQFLGAARALRLYGEQHPAAAAALDGLFSALAAALAGAGSISYEVRSGTVFASGAALDDDGLVARPFVADCAARHIECLTFAAGLTRAELAQAVSLFARDPEALVVDGGFAEALRARRVIHVR